MEKEETDLLNDIRRLFPTERLYQEFLLFREMTDEERDTFEEKNREWVDSLSPEEQEQHVQNLIIGAKQAVEYYGDIILKEQLGNVPEYISLSKIAKNYFGKSSSWLYHRLKGTLINGKPAKFTEEQRLKLAGAFDELANDFKKASQTLRAAV
jgi:hypothetical protein